MPAGSLLGSVFWFMDPPRSLRLWHQIQHCEKYLRNCCRHVTPLPRVGVLEDALAGVGHLPRNDDFASPTHNWQLPYSCAAVWGPIRAARHSNAAAATKP